MAAALHVFQVHADPWLSSLQYVLAVLDFSRPSAIASPRLSSAQANPSPVLFPPSPTPSASSPDPSGSHRPAVNPAQSSPTALSLIALDTLLCALVDRPKNMRVFEQAGGLAGIVKVLKDKSVAQVVRRVLRAARRELFRSSLFLCQDQGHRAPLLLPPTGSSPSPFRFLLVGLLHLELRRRTLHCSSLPSSPPRLRRRRLHPSNPGSTASCSLAVISLVDAVAAYLANSAAEVGAFDTSAWARGG